MNIYLLIYCALHVGIVIILAFNVMFQYLKMKSMNVADGMSVKAVIEISKNIHRTRTFLFRSIVGFVATIFFQGLAFWLLWMGGIFEN